jgi:hypothetical protein
LLILENRKEEILIKEKKLLQSYLEQEVKEEEAIERIREFVKEMASFAKKAELISNNQALEAAMKSQKELYDLLWQRQVISDRIQQLTNENSNIRNQIQLNKRSIIDLGNLAFIRISGDLSGNYKSLTDRENNELFMQSWEEAKDVNELREIYKQKVKSKLVEKYGEGAETNPEFIKEITEGDKRTDLAFSKLESYMQPLLGKASELRERDEKLESQFQRNEEEKVVRLEQLVQIDEKIVIKIEEVNMEIPLAAVETGRTIEDVAEEVREKPKAEYVEEKQKEFADEEKLLDQGIEELNKEMEDIDKEIEESGDDDSKIDKLLQKLGEKTTAKDALVERKKELEEQKKSLQKSTQPISTDVSVGEDQANDERRSKP